MATILFIDRAAGQMSPHVRAGLDMGHVVEMVPDCEEAWRSVERRRPDAVVVGRLSGDVLRYDLCRRLRTVVPAGKAAIIVLAPPSASLTRIRCLEEGADSVVDDDIGPDRLWSRIGALIAPKGRSRTGERLVYGKIEMLVEEHKVVASGVPLALNLTSFAILRIFLEHPETILTRPYVSEALGRLHQERTIDVHIRTLRLAMKPGGADELIVTVPQAGYMLCDRAICDCRSTPMMPSSRAIAR